MQMFMELSNLFLYQLIFCAALKVEDTNRLQLLGLTHKGSLR